MQLSPLSLFEGLQKQPFGLVSCSHEAVSCKLLVCKQIIIIITHRHVQAPHCSILHLRPMLGSLSIAGGRPGERGFGQRRSQRLNSSSAAGSSSSPRVTALPPAAAAGGSGSAPDHGEEAARTTTDGSESRKRRLHHTEANVTRRARGAGGATELIVSPGGPQRALHSHRPAGVRRAWRSGGREEGGGSRSAAGKRRAFLTARGSGGNY